MEAGYKGAKIVVGLNIKLPVEQKRNIYIKYFSNLDMITDSVDEVVDYIVKYSKINGSRKEIKEC
jgi:predicted Rossmann-fold nucleotide-binding protein